MDPDEQSRYVRQTELKVLNAKTPLIADAELPTKQELKRKKIMKFGVGIMALTIFLIVLIAVITGDEAEDNGGGSVEPWWPESATTAYRYEQDVTFEPRANCNDGSRAPFYVRHSTTGSKKWIVFFDGGNACYSELTCAKRWEDVSEMMKGREEPEMLNMCDLFHEQTCILHADEEVNPYWYDFNAVFVQYCSSDSYLGDATYDEAMAADNIPFEFNGMHIARGVFRELFRIHGMDTAETIVLAGVSAGSFGVLTHSNYLVDLAAEKAPQADVRAWLDSGFWLLNEPWRPAYVEADCDTDTWETCLIDNCMRLSHERLNTVQNDECREANPDYTWECNFPEIVYPYLRINMFVSQQQYDKLQLIGAGISIPEQKYAPGIDFTLSRGIEWRNAFEAAGLKNLWTSSCSKHDITDKPEVFSMSISSEYTDYVSITAAQAAIEWMEGTDVVYMDTEYCPDINPTCPDYNTPAEC